MAAHIQWASSLQPVWVARIVYASREAPGTCRAQC